MVLAQSKFYCRSLKSDIFFNCSMNSQHLCFSIKKKEYNNINSMSNIQISSTN